MPAWTPTVLKTQVRLDEERPERAVIHLTLNEDDFDHAPGVPWMDPDAGDLTPRAKVLHSRTAVDGPMVYFWLDQDVWWYRQEGSRLSSKQEPAKGTHPRSWHGGSPCGACEKEEEQA